MMNTATVLIDWAFRSSILILSGALLLRALRVKDPSIRLAGWTAMLAGSLLIPALAAALPELPFDINAFVRRAIPARSIEAPPMADQATHSPLPAVPIQSEGVVSGGYNAADRDGVSSSRFDPWSNRWMDVVAIVYVVIAGTLLLRLSMGLTISLRLLRESQATGQTTEGIEIRESNRVHAPVTLGIVHSAIVLPADWRQWDGVKLEAVLAHERSHIGRHDPALQLLSLIHRALLWHSPLSWFLHRRIVQTAEEASDDAAVAVTGNRAGYAELLLSFMEHGVRRTKWPNWRGADGGGVAMARYGLPEGRIHRIVYGKTLSHGVTGWSLVAILTLGSPLACLVSTAQARPQFQVADIRVDKQAVELLGMLQEATLLGDRYEIHDATLVDLIRTAYGVEAVAVVGGPSWLELDRFDVVAKAPANATAASAKLMLQSLLADRFKLVVRQDTKPMPAWLLSKGPEPPKLKPAAGADSSGCRTADNNSRLACRSVTMDEFVAILRGRDTMLPVVNSTGIEEAWDFDLNYAAGSSGTGVSENSPLLDAVNKQLGLKLEIQNVPQRVIAVESVNRTPTANSPEAEKLLAPPVAFQVASIRPCATWAPEDRSSPSGQTSSGCKGMDWHIATAWNLSVQIQGQPNNVMTLYGDLPGAPKWLSTKYFDIVAKAPIGIGQLTADPNYRVMLRNLLVERFKMVTHFEDRVANVYTLVATKPKFKQADPSSRSGCRATGNLRGVPNVVKCQNVTMAQFAEQLNHHLPVLSTGRRVFDATSLEGTWDLTFSYGVAAGLAAANEAGVASEPRRTVTLFQALEQQLGLKLEEARRPVPFFVIDHIEEDPTEN